MDIDDFIELFDDGVFSLLVPLGVIVGGLLVEWAGRHFARRIRRYGAKISGCGLTGELAAKRLLRACGLDHIEVVAVDGLDHYDTKRRQVRLNHAMYQSPSVAALAVAAHEVGHAQQFAAQIMACRLRKILRPVFYALPLAAIFVSLWLWLGDADLLGFPIGLTMLLTFVATFVFQLPIHLPLERDATRRAREMVREHGLIAEDELTGFEDVLTAGWWTHAAYQARIFIMLVVFAAATMALPALLDSSDEIDLSQYRKQATVEAEFAGDQQPVFSLPEHANYPNSPTPHVVPLTAIVPALFSWFAETAVVIGILIGLWILSFKYQRGRKVPKAPSELAIEQNNIGRQLMLEGDPAAAVEYFTRALAMDPSCIFALVNRGAAQITLGQFEDALKDFDAAVALQPSSAFTRTHRGYGYLALDDYDRTIEDFSEALRYDAESPELLRDRGLCFYFKEDYGAALRDLDAAISLIPDDAASYNNRGAAYLKMDHYDNALSDLQTAIQLDPEFANSYKNLAWLQATCPDVKYRDGAAAVTHATKAMDLTQWQHREWLEILAAAHAEAGQFEQAVDRQREAVEQASPDRREARQARLDLFVAGRPFRETRGQVSTPSSAITMEFDADSPAIEAHHGAGN